MRRPRAVIFDFDYTLADSSEGVVDCVRYAQRGLGLPLSDPGAIRRTIGLSVPDTVAVLCGEDQRPRSDEFGRLFLERADQVMAACTAVYPAVPGVLRWLRECGLPCAIATTKYRFRIEEILRRDGLAGLVAAVVGAEDVAAHKPDPAGLEAALGQLSVSAGEALYVGDSLPDAGAAQAAGVSFVAVLSGTTPVAAFTPYKPLAILPDVAGLPGWLDGAGPRSARGQEAGHGG